MLHKNKYKNHVFPIFLLFKFLGCYTSPDPTRVGASGTGSSLFLSNIYTCVISENIFSHWSFVFPKGHTSRRSSNSPFSLLPLLSFPGTHPIVTRLGCSGTTRVPIVLKSYGVCSYLYAYAVRNMHQQYSELYSWSTYISSFRL
jgi:hypothetical protein